MKVIFVTRGYPSPDNLMSGNYEAVQAWALAKMGVNVSVLCMRKAKNAKKEGIEVFSENGIKVYRYNIKYPLFAKSILSILYNSFWEKAIFALYLRYVEDNGEADILHAHIVSIANWCKLLLRKKQIPMVITEHWSRINYSILKDPRLLWWGRMYSSSSCVIAVSNSLAQSLKRKFNVNSLVIGNMVEDFFFKRKEEQRNDGLFKFVAVGNLVPRKGFDILIDAFARCSFSDRVILQIVGGGEEYGHLQQQIENLGLQNRIKLLGMKKPEEVGRILEQSDCYVLSSHVETFGIVCIEAMAKGLPVIATACQGPEDFINDNNGILIPSNDVAALANAMNKIYKNIDKYNSELIRNFCYENYSEKAIANKILEVYNKVLKA